MNTSHDFHKVRKEYEDQGIDPTTLPELPMELFRQWYQNAVDNQPAEWFEPNAVSLATSSAAGHVTNRYILIKGITDQGIQFFTNYDSRKGQQLADNPRAAVAMHWPYLGRQVRLEGAVSKTTPDVSEHYFHSRPRGSQISAATSPQSQPVASREFLDDRSKSFQEQYEGQTIPLPENWGGYLLTIDLIEFWQGRPDRLHDRIIYRMQDGHWHRERWAP